MPAAPVERASRTPALPAAYAAVAAVMLVVAVALRVNNALAFPPLRGYDGFGHFTYVWYVAVTGRIPLPTTGWSFFHPPLYYAAMAALWNALAPADALARLRVGSLAMAFLSLTHAGVLFVIVRRYFPGRPLVHLLAPGLMLFLPVHVYSAPFLGNEGLAAVFCSLAILALLAALAWPSWTRGALLGACLGLALLTKSSAVAVAAGAVATLALAALRARPRRPRLAQLAVAVGVALAVSGWYYGRNVALYGTPFVMSRGELLLVRQVENLQPQARRSLAEYLLFDPVILRRPAWPRGFSMTGDLDPRGAHRALRHSVWTGLYANTWFDGFGGWVLPTVTDSELARRAGQALLCLGLLPTALMLIGLGTALVRLARTGWDDTLVAMLALLAAMLGLFVYGTRAAPIPAAVKATYLTPISVVFGFWFALGLATVTTRRPRLAGPIAAVCAVLAGLVTVVFWHGLLFGRGAIFHHLPHMRASAENVYGMVYYAAGDRETARRWFTSAAADEWHLGYENLALLALEAGRPLEALHLMKRALRLQPEQALGTPIDRAAFNRVTRAEYLNTMAVMYHALGRQADALRAAEAARALDGTIPEVHYNLGALRLLAARRAEPVDPATVRQAEVDLGRALALDRGFTEAEALLAVARALVEGCAGAATPAAAGRAPRPARVYPVETGPGAEHAASIGRRRIIRVLPDEIPAGAAARCAGVSATTPP